MHLDAAVATGVLPHSTVGDPGSQGPTVTGTHGIGVSTPRAAAVAAATIGLASEVHIPNGRMLTIGTVSVIVANGRFVPIVRLTGKTTSDEGATPNEHISSAPLTIGWPISGTSLEGGRNGHHRWRVARFEL